MKKTVQALPLDWFSMKCSAFLRKKRSVIAHAPFILLVNSALTEFACAYLKNDAGTGVSVLTPN
jgi:hypothetical protein